MLYNAGVHAGRVVRVSQPVMEKLCGLTNAEGMPHLLTVFFGLMKEYKMPGGGRTALMTCLTTNCI